MVLRFLLFGLLFIAPAKTLGAQEPPPADSAPGEVTPAEATPADSAPAEVAPATPGAAVPGQAPPAGAVVGDTIPVAGAAAETTAPQAAVEADSVARADSLGEVAAADSLERVRREAAEARERLRDVREGLANFPAEERLRRSPRGAVIRAFLLPGWGQFYTGHRFRGFLYAGAEVGFATLGFLKQRDVNEFKDDISRARLGFVSERLAEAQTTNPDTTFSLEDTLAVFARFDATPEGAVLAAQLEAKQKRREDYFTYAIFSVLFAAIDAFVSAQLEPFEEGELGLRRGSAGWQVELKLPLASTAGPGVAGSARPDPAGHSVAGRMPRQSPSLHR